MADVRYPLHQVLEVKEKRVDDAEKIMLAKRKALEVEEEKLAQRKAELNKVKQHYQDKLKQMRDELDGGTTSPKIQQMKVYVKVVQDKVKVEEKKVSEQQVRVDAAKKELETAKENLRLKRLEVDKLVTHRKDWEKTDRKEQEIIEGRISDEIGDVIFTSNQRKKRS